VVLEIEKYKADKLSMKIIIAYCSTIHSSKDNIRLHLPINCMKE
jgi:hypothetical protein